MLKKATVKLSKKLVDKVQVQVDESKGELKNVEEYIEFILMELLREDETEQVYTPEEEEEIRERSRRPGYIQ